MKRFYTRATAFILMMTFLLNSSAMAATVRVYGGSQPMRYANVKHRPAVNYNYVYSTRPAVNYTYVNYYEPAPTYIQTTTYPTYTTPVVYQPVPVVSPVPVVYQQPAVYQPIPVATTTVNEYYVNENRNNSGVAGALLGAAALTVGIVALSRR